MKIHVLQIAGSVKMGLNDLRPYLIDVCIHEKELLQSPGGVMALIAFRLQERFCGLHKLSPDISVDCVRSFLEDEFLAGDKRGPEDQSGRREGVNKDFGSAYEACVPRPDSSTAE